MKLGISHVEIMWAFEQRGCPVCFLIRRTEERYLFGFAWEQVTDAFVRERLAASLGFCPRHTWQLKAVEEAQTYSHMGTAIVCEDMASRVQAGLQEMAAAQRESAGEAPRGLAAALRTRIGNILRRWPPGTRRDALLPSAPMPSRVFPLDECPLCADVRFGVACDLQAILDGCSDRDVREAYQRSDGLCLPHLRQALGMAERGQREQALFLLETAIEKLDGLLALLREHLRKQSYQFRSEPRTVAEERSWRRVLAFMAGEESTTMLACGQHRF